LERRDFKALRVPKALRVLKAHLELRVSKDPKVQQALKAPREVGHTSSPSR
jgi:hypothetical protein